MPHTSVAILLRDEIRKGKPKSCKACKHKVVHAGFAALMSTAENTRSISLDLIRQ